jgi:hypothetical protein
MNRVFLELEVIYSSPFTWLYLADSPHSSVGSIHAPIISGELSSKHYARAYYNNTWQMRDLHLFTDGTLGKLEGAKFLKAYYIVA